jgi:hypothetical protein
MVKMKMRREDDGRGQFRSPTIIKAKNNDLNECIISNERQRQIQNSEMPRKTQETAFVATYSTVSLREWMIWAWSKSELTNAIRYTVSSERHKVDITGIFHDCTSITAYEKAKPSPWDCFIASDFLQHPFVMRTHYRPQSMRNLSGLLFQEGLQFQPTMKHRHFREILR